MNDDDARMEEMGPTPADGDVDMGVAKRSKAVPSKRGQRTTKQKKKKAMKMERALAVADKMQSKVKQTSTKKAKKKSAKSLY